MKLIFTKEPNNDIKIQLQKGLIVEEFTYTEMIRQLLVSNDFEDSEFKDLSDEEEEKIREMLDKITDVFEEDKEDEVESDNGINDL